ncbi:MAG: esterase family protein, partial [Bacteroidales bacterium]|nr:esterase family protein [Bacteroidales bacterium]
MKKIFLPLIMLLCSVIGANAGKIVTDSIKSNILNFTIKYNVYLPDGFDQSDEQYPVVYLLHG